MVADVAVGEGVERTGEKLPIARQLRLLNHAVDASY